MKQLPAELEFERLSAEDKLQKAVPGYMKRIRRLYDAVYDRFGEAGLDLIRDVSSNYGAEIGNNINRRGGLKGVTAVGRYLLKVFDIVFAMTNGQWDTQVLANLMFDWMFRGGGDFGRGAAIAVIIMLLVVPIMIWNIRQANEEQKGR